MAVADKQLNGAIRKVGDTLEGARRFHPEALGKGVNPDKSFAHWMFCVGTGRHKELWKTYGGELEKQFGDGVEGGSGRSKLGVQKSPLSIVGGGPAGGYLVPTSLREDLMFDVSEESFIRPDAQVKPMTSAVELFPWFDMETTTGTAGVPTFFGGMQLQFNEEAATNPETEPKYRQLELKANDLTGNLVMSNTLLQDGTGLEKWLRRLIARSIGWFEDYFFLRGSGVGQPLGIINSGALIAAARGSATTIKYVDVSTMMADLLPYSYIHGAWLVTVGAQIQLLQLLDASGKTAWVPNYPIGIEEDGEQAKRAKGSLFGLPLYTTEKLPALGTLGDIIVYDPSLYVIGDRQTVEIAVSEHVKFTNNQTVWRVLERIDGRPLFDQTVKLSDQATIVSPYVGLHA